MPSEVVAAVEVVEVRDQARQVTQPVAVAVGEGAQVEVVDHAVAPPEEVRVRHTWLLEEWGIIQAGAGQRNGGRGMKSKRKVVLVLWMVGAHAPGGLRASVGRRSCADGGAHGRTAPRRRLGYNGGDGGLAQPLDLPSPTARRGLEATDPTTVRLDAGRPTLVEFFAFW